MVLQACGCLFALCFGGVFSAVAQEWGERHRRKKQIQARLRASPQAPVRGCAEAVIALWDRLSLELRARSSGNHAFYQVIFMRRAQRWMAQEGQLLGVPSLSAEGLSATCFTCGLTGGLVAMVLGYGFGMSFGGLFGVCLVCFFAASGIPFRAARGYIQTRCENMESELPRMLAMVSLGMRSGLSFDKSFALYPREFSTEFAQACANAQKRWELSLVTREESLRELAKSYDSALFRQATESMIRSLRLGGALSQNLDALASEARDEYRSRCEEAIAKAPVKMLVPTGALILPAMLILVMGPVLLEMMGGF